jgi:hypothetical protein
LALALAGASIFYPLAFQTARIFQGRRRERLEKAGYPS